ncbi:prepilin peptidase [Thioclava sp. A2]|uniref:A24 family peptidase n=1 Tax=Thioclava sp. FCG-A2 TaxID=3080562 RepID=UPI0029541E68|nr:prepilin peptidase [Thioclava sp. A2]MDV7269942.1 prepilin peptidase [Thioclava sp. A2]
MRADLLLLALVLPLVVAAALSDLRRLKIPNSYVLVAVVIFLGVAPVLLTLDDLGARVLGAGIALAIGFVLFGLRLFGGGDVKMMAALMLFVPVGASALFMQMFSLALLVTAGGMLFVQRAGGHPDWASVQARGKMPVGVPMALAVAGLLILL